MSTETKPDEPRTHTRGPWLVDGQSITAHHGCGGLVQVVAECGIYENVRNRLSAAERDRNAALISAAPDLLAALSAIIEDGSGYASVPEFRAAREALRKARGES